MYLYKINSVNGDLEQIKEKGFNKEKDLQLLCEQNLNQLLRLQFICSEFSLSNFRIDTLAFDESASSFVIIEYKNNKNFSVIDQGYAYLSLMLNNKADFILEYNENCEGNLKRDDVDWSQSRIIFISPIFTTYQKQSINFRDLPIELWEVKKYENETVQFQQIQSTETTESINTISQSTTIERVSQEIKVYSEVDHLEGKPNEINELYQGLKERILNLDDNFTVNPLKKHISFVSNGKIIVDLVILKKAIKIFINLRAWNLNDPRNIARDVSAIGHWGNGDYQITITTDEDFDYIEELIKQSIILNV
ncbi:DUF5655 domain-containing protein [Litchfieldia alkalitelluris]|uniref:DUF5655 domain-containing protein n=1 Tax=Litchfieldia alkalitelluris TaxID=304268 RepID=UPI0009963D52|nr:DUF5655 domain-containing protein [Litchfieldia alkalitelluris]